MRASFVLAGSGLLAMAVVAACVGDDPVPGGAGTDGGGIVDGPTTSPDTGSAVDGGGGADSGDSGPGPRCDPNKGFGIPTADPFANVNSTNNDTAPYLSDDEKTMWFGRGDLNAANGSSWDIYVATRDDADGVFGAASQVMGGINATGNQDDGPVVSTDGLTMFFTGERSSLADIYTSTRDSGTGAWGAAVAVTALNDPSADVAGDLRAGELWFYSGRSDAGTSYIFHVPIDGGSFGSIAPQTELGSNVHSPRLTRDGNRIFYTDGSEDVLTAVRGGGTGPFTTQGAVPNINSSDSDRPGWVSPDGCRLYFFSTRNPGKGWDIYVAQRQK
jgi:hypothetical protein